MRIRAYGNCWALDGARRVDMKRIRSIASLRQTLALWCAWAYLAATIPLIPLATACLAWIDGDHRVSIGFTGDSLNVILAHDSRDPQKSPDHIHCALTQGVLLFQGDIRYQETPQDGSSDHVLQFRHCQVPSQRENREPWMSKAPGQCPGFLSALAFNLPASAEKLTASVPDSPPVSPSVQVARTTILVI